MVRVLQTAALTNLGIRGDVAENREGDVDQNVAVAAWETASEIGGSGTDGDNNGNLTLLDVCE